MLDYNGDFIPLVRMRDRLRRSRDDSDVTYFYDLMSAGEMVLKIAVAALVATVRRDPENLQYGVEAGLVRADGVGDWARALDDVLTGPPSSYLEVEARPAQRDFTETVAAGDWRAESLAFMNAAAQIADGRPPAYRRAQLRQWAHTFARLRNAEKAHGAPGAEACARLAAPLEDSLRSLVSGAAVFQWPWAVIKRNLSGKYRVAPLGGDQRAFQELRDRSDIALDGGIYVHVGGPRHVRLAHSDVDISDFFVANGGFTDKTYEMLSYITGAKHHADSVRYLRLPAPIPRSETQASDELKVRGNVLTNMPHPVAGYVRRPELEEELKRLILDDRHPVVTLTGRGGIGKTSLALQVLDDASYLDRFHSIWWFSARDIDLLPHGPKQVQPDIADIRDIARQYVKLARSDDEPLSRDEALESFHDALASSATIGTSLFVFDNFETVTEPTALYEWLDECIRTPNKILVTTRVRTFKADYPIEVGGMTFSEFDQLVSDLSRTLGIAGLIKPGYVEELHSEAGGHPYVAKILLGEVARTRRTGSVERIMATNEEILTALFERTFAASLSPAAQRAFLTLSAWRSIVPEIAIKAVLLRPSNERMDVDGAIDELLRSSLVEPYEGPDGERFLRVPLAAQLFGASKLKVSGWKTSIDNDVTLLRAFGAAQESDVRGGMAPRVKALLKTVGNRMADDPAAFAEVAPILEYVGSRFPAAWLGLANLHRQRSELENEATWIGRYLQARPGDADAWRRLARNAARRGDALAELNAGLQLAELPDTPYREISELANRFNGYLKSNVYTGELGDKDVLAARLRSLMEGRLAEADANDLSRLGWLCVHLHDVEAAHEYARQGLAIDRSNQYCQKLAQLPRHGSR